MRTGGAQGFDMKAKRSFWISVFAVVACGLCIAAFELGRVPYVTKEVYDGTFWEKFTTSPPNEIGDTLAGVFGSLAFAAAAVAVVMQSFELKAQREELRLTRAVLAEQKKSTQDMAFVMADQLLYLKEDRAERVLVALLNSLCRCLEDARNESEFCNWLMYGYPGRGYSKDFEFNFQNPDSFLRRVKLGIEGRFDGFLANEAGEVEYDSVFYCGSPSIPYLAEASNLIDQIFLLENRLSDGEKVRLLSLNLKKLKEMIGVICDNPEEYAYAAEPEPEGWSFL